MFFTLDIGTEVIAYPDTEARIGKGIVELRIESVGVAGPLHILHQKITYIQAQIQFVAQHTITDTSTGSIGTFPMTHLVMTRSGIVTGKTGNQRFGCIQIECVTDIDVIIPTAPRKGVTLVTPFFVVYQTIKALEVDGEHIKIGCIFTGNLPVFPDFYRYFHL